MKFILVLMVAICTNAFATQSYDATGAVKAYQKEYLTVVNSASTALTVGMVVCPDLSDDNGIGVDFCATSGFPALCVINDTSCAVGARCKCQTKGMMETVKFGAAQGNAVAGGSAFAHTDGLSYGDTTDDNKEPFGIYMDAVSATGSVQVYIQL